MDPTLQKILEDLYALEPSLRAREQELVTIIQELVAAKPDTRFDETFARQLRARLMEQAEARSHTSSIFNILSMNKKWAFALGALVLAAVVSIPQLYKTMRQQSDTPRLALVTQLEDGAFGSLTLGPAATPLGSGGDMRSVMGVKSVAESVADQAISDPAPATAPIAIEGGRGSGATSIASPMIVHPYIEEFKFKYTGEPLAMSESNMDVLRRVKQGVAGNIAGLLSGSGLNAVDWSRLGNQRLQNISFIAGANNDYSVYINADDGSISINRQWVDGSVRCLALECRPQPLRPEDMPADDKIIAAANAFLDEFGISRASYGNPVVQDEWRVMYAAASTKERAAWYAPEVVSVVYPLFVHGRTVHDESGNVSGLTVSVNARELKAVSVWNLATAAFESSAYATEQNTDRLIHIVERGGFRRGYYYAEGDDIERKVHTFELGTPTIGYVRLWIYKDNKGEELFVPAYIFSITKKPDGVYYYQQNVIVPLIKEILDQDNEGLPKPIPLPAVEDKPLR